MTIDSYPRMVKTWPLSVAPSAPYFMNSLMPLYGIAEQFDSDRLNRSAWPDHGLSDHDMTTQMA